MIHTLAAIHAARARKQIAGAKAVTAEVRKRRRPGVAVKEPHAQPGQAGEKADE